MNKNVNNTCIKILLDKQDVCLYKTIGTNIHNTRMTYRDTLFQKRISSFCASRLTATVTRRTSISPIMRHKRLKTQAGKRHRRSLNAVESGECAGANVNRSANWVFSFGTEKFIPKYTICIFHINRKIVLMYCLKRIGLKFWGQKIKTKI